MTVWDEIPFLVEYTKKNPPPIPPRTRKYKGEYTKKYKKWLQEEHEWELQGIREFIRVMIRNAK